MPTATKLGSGQWRCQFYIDGKRRSVTRATKKEAEYAALEMTLKQKHESSNFTVGKAIDDYITIKDGVLSPSTIAGYKKYVEIIFNHSWTCRSMRSRARSCRPR